MSEAFLHRGFTIEPNVSGPPTLRIEGVTIVVTEVDGVFSSPAAPGVHAGSVIELAERIVDASAERQSRERVQPQHVAKLKEGVAAWNAWRRDNPDIRPLLHNEKLNGPKFRPHLRQADFAHADLSGADLQRARLDGANFHGANLAGANLANADLIGANFCRSDLYRTNLSGANLRGANLQGAQLAKTIFKDATLDDCTIYGLSAWDLELEGASQKNLRILYTDSSDGSRQEILIDDLSVAQFVYFLLHNKDIRRAIDTITSKVVLVLGRFSTPERKEVLDAIREALRQMRLAYVPVMFDFEPPSNQNYIETVVTLAHMARFVIADMTDARFVLAEVPAIARSIAVPIQPVQLEGGEESIIVRDLRKNHRSVLNTFFYRDKSHLLEALESAVVAPAERLSAELRAM